MAFCENLGRTKVTRAPLGTLGAPELSGSSRPSRVSRFPRDAGPRWAGQLGPRAVEARPGSGKARHVAGFLPGPPPSPQGPPFLDQVQARDPRRAAHSLPPLLPSPSHYSAPPRLFALPLSLTHHLVYTHPCTPPSLRRAPKSPGWAHLSDPNISAIRSARRRLAPGSLPPVIVLLDHTVRAPYGALAPVVK